MTTQTEHRADRAEMYDAEVIEHGQELSIHERMVAILGAMPAIGKNQRNQQQGFMFRGHDDVLNALNPLLAKHGVIIVPDVLERETAQRTTAKGGVMYEVNLHIRFTFYGLAGDSLTASTWGEGTDSGDKSTSKAMTMAFKNVLNQAFAISTTETQDADAETPETTTGREMPGSGGGEPPPDKPKMANKTVMAEIARLIAKLEASQPTAESGGESWADAMRAHVGGKHGEKMTSEQAEKAIEFLKKADVPFG